MNLSAYSDSGEQDAELREGGGEALPQETVPQPDARRERHPSGLHDRQDDEGRQLATATGQARLARGRVLPRHRPPGVRGGA